MSVPPPRSIAPVSPGEVLAGKYRVERVLGVGGMGVVVAALHLELDERVAVKFLLPEISQNSEAAARFMREARAAARIKSEHVARVIDVGRLESGSPYMVMEYLTGQDLAAAVQQGPFEIEAAVEYLIQACHAMAEAHAAGIVHRDLKPANLFLSETTDGALAVKVLDFGISKVSGGELGDASLTKTSAMMGSPFYMSPEQMRSSRDVDKRTDIWSLGTILFELLAGKPPFRGETLPELVTRIMADSPPQLRALRPEVPEALEQVVLRCLEKSRDARFQNVGELARALLPFAPRRSRYTAERVLKLAGGSDDPPISRSLGPSEYAGTAGVGARTATAWAETGGPKRNPNQTRRLLVMSGAVIVLGAGAAFSLRSLRTTPPISAVARSASVEEPARPTAAVPAQSFPPQRPPQLVPVETPDPGMAGTTQGGKPSIALLGSASVAKTTRAPAGAPAPTAQSLIAAAKSARPATSDSGSPKLEQPAILPEPAKTRRNPLAIELK